MADAAAPHAGAGGGAGAGAGSQQDHRGADKEAAWRGDAGEAVAPPHEVFSGDVDGAKALVDVLTCLHNGKKDEHALVTVNENGERVRKCFLAGACACCGLRPPCAPRDRTAAVLVRARQA